MRLDKFLKVSRLIKRRTLAKEVAEGGRIAINDRTAKPATEVKAGDQLAINFGARQLRVQILEVRETARVSEAPGMYEVLADVRIAIDPRGFPPAGADLTDANDDRDDAD